MQLLARDPVSLQEYVRVAQQENRIQIIFEKIGQEQTIIGTDLLVATGRKPNIQHLNLEAAGVRYTTKGIEVDAKLRTSNKHIYAIGDVVGSYQFTHVANYHAGIVIRNILFRLPTKVNYKFLPWVTFTDPELAHVGMGSFDLIFRLDVTVYDCPL